MSRFRYKSDEVKRTRNLIAHNVAVCRDCDWQDGDQLQAARRATKHARETGHTVHVDQGTCYEVSIGD